MEAPKSTQKIFGTKEETTACPMEKVSQEECELCKNHGDKVDKFVEKLSDETVREFVGLNRIKTVKLLRITLERLLKKADTDPSSETTTRIKLLIEMMGEVENRLIREVDSHIKTK